MGFRQLRVFGLCVAVLLVGGAATVEALPQEDAARGFVGPIRSVVLQEYPAHLAATDGGGFARKANPLVRSQVIGASSLDFDDPEFDCLKWWDTLEPEGNLWEVGYIVANLSNESVTVEVIMKVKGPVKDTARGEFTIPAMSQSLFTIDVSIAGTGYYLLIGKVKGDVRGTKGAKGGFFVEEVF